MPRATTQQIIDVYRARGLQISGPTPQIRRGQGGHYYVVTRQPSHVQLARITNNSGDREVNLMRINDTYMIYVGAGATMTLFMPSLGGGIEEVVWIAHTHPLERETADAAIARGATPADWAVLRRIFEDRGGRTEVTSRVILCRDGAVEEVVPFTVRPRARRPSLGSLRASDDAFE